MLFRKFSLYSSLAAFALLALSACGDDSSSGGNAHDKVAIVSTFDKEVMDKDAKIKILSGLKSVDVSTLMGEPLAVEEEEEVAEDEEEAEEEVEEAPAPKKQAKGAKGKKGKKGKKR